VVKRPAIGEATCVYIYMYTRMYKYSYNNAREIRTRETIWKIRRAYGTRTCACSEVCVPEEYTCLNRYKTEARARRVCKKRVKCHPHVLLALCIT